ncbi:MAG: hypothetical protein NUW00_00570 [Candidatus Kaiserbacteria bacterium]|nr:hypothetical protein [Candidatus Kaiserbacteria bacterium]
MDTEVISAKQILVIGALSSCMLLILTAVTFLNNKSEMRLCNEQSKITIILRNTKNEHVLISNASVKNILDCLGRELPFYKRSIEYVSIEDASKREEIAKRYHILETTLPASFGELSIEKSSTNIFRFTHERESDIVFTTIPSSPFRAVQYIQGEFETVYMPQNSSNSQGLLDKLIANTGSKLRTLKNGELYVHRISL